jgi:hypothetical protein
MNVTEFTKEFDKIKMSDGRMNMTELKPLIETMIEKEGDKMQDETYYKRPEKRSRGGRGGRTGTRS